MAKVFRFRLAVVEKIRRREQTLQRRRVADAVRAQTAMQDRIGDLTADLSASVAATSISRQAGMVDVQLLRLSHFRRGWLERRIEESRAELSQRAAEVSTERSALATATQRLRVIEKLRERKWGGHQFEVRKEERAAMDEVAGQLFLRKRAEGRSGWGSAG